MVDEGARVYIERIDIRGNTRTRDYVVRREFDISEGDAFNRVLISKAERRIRDLGYFKTVTINTEPGSAPDRVIVVRRRGRQRRKLLRRMDGDLRLEHLRARLCAEPLAAQHTGEKA